MVRFYGVIIVLCVISMITLIVDAQHNTVLEHKDIKWFTITFVLVMIGALCEFAGVVLDQMIYSPAWMHRVVTITEFSLTPFLPLALSRSIRIKKPLMVMDILMGVHCCLEFALFPFKLIFYITPDGHFERGPLFFVYMLFCLVSFIYIIAVFIYLGRKNKSANPAVMILIILIMVVGQVAVIVHEVNSGYISICFTAILLYIFTQNLQRRQLLNTIDSEHRIANSDSLTGVSSRHHYEYKINQLNELIKEKSQDVEFAVCECDLNNLKKINDTYGHEYGDNYIKACCKVICNMFKHSQVFRIGGDEFVVLIQGDDYYDLEGLKIMLKEFSENEVRKNSSVLEQLSFAAGFAKYNLNLDRSYNDVFKRADIEMYANKKELKKMMKEMKK